ncbi:MAG: hypothetical protein QM729_17115 [Solirubrobacterales bacterium]
MTISISRVDGPWPVRPVSDPQRDETRGTAAGDFASDLAQASSTATSSPPPEVSAEVREAADAAASLLEEGRELRFDQDDEGRLRVQLQDRQGNVLRQVPTSEIFDFAEGKVTS